MKATIHPQMFTDTKVVCVCGNSFVTGSTKQSLSVEVCSKCHPFYTGEQRFLDTKGHVDRFVKKMQVAKAYKENNASKKDKKNQKDEKKPMSLRELLGQM